MMGFTPFVPQGGSGGGINPPAGDIGGSVSVPTVVSTHLSAGLPIAQGGTGQTAQQAAMDALAGAQTSGQYLRGNGTHVLLAAISAGDVPTLNQNTTGTAANITGVAAIANGGTGQTTQQAAINALAGTQTSGQFLRGNGTNVLMAVIAAGDLPVATTGAVGGLKLPAASSATAPANPTGSTSTTGVMCGFAKSFTPSNTGTVLVIIAGFFPNANVGSNTVVGARFGTGTAPVNGAAITGTRIGGTADPTSINGTGSATVMTPFTFIDVLALTAGTTYWFDLFEGTTSGSTAVAPADVKFVCIELVN